MRPGLAVAAVIAALVGGCGGDEGPASPSDEEQGGSSKKESPSASAGEVSSCREGIPADPQWRTRSSVTGPFGFFGPGRNLRHLAREGDRFMAKLPVIVARGRVVTLRIPSRKQGSVSLGYQGVGGHVEEVTFEACGDRPATAWPGGLVLPDRRPVTLIVEVEGEPRVPVRVGRL